MSLTTILFLGLALTIPATLGINVPRSVALTNSGIDLIPPIFECHFRGEYLLSWVECYAGCRGTESCYDNCDITYPDCRGALLNNSAGSTGPRHSLLAMNEEIAETHKSNGVTISSIDSESKTVEAVFRFITVQGRNANRHIDSNDPIPTTSSNVNARRGFTGAALPTPLYVNARRGTEYVNARQDPTGDLAAAPGYVNARRGSEYVNARQDPTGDLGEGYVNARRGTEYVNARQDPTGDLAAGYVNARRDPTGNGVVPTPAYVNARRALPDDGPAPTAAYVNA